MSDRLDWPVSFERTPTGDRTRNNSFDVSLSKAFDDLEAELSRLEVNEFRYSFDAQQRQRDQRPYARASPNDPGFVLRWSMGGEQYAVACDRFSRLRDNVRTVGLYIREKRKMEQRPVVTGGSEFANARLPPAEGDAIVSEVPPHTVLDIEPNADNETICKAARKLKKATHPDLGGDREHFQQVVEAEEAMLDD